MNVNQQKALQTQAEIRLIKSKDLDGFKNYLKSQKLTREAIKFLFEKGRKKNVEIYVNTVYPFPSEFRVYQNQVMKYANRPTLATYYLYYKVKPQGEIELIKRNELIPFLYYVTNYGLSPKAFKYLIEKGARELVEGYFNNNTLDGEFLDIFLQSCKIGYIKMYLEKANTHEKEEMAQALISKKEHKKALEHIYRYVPMFRFWLDCA